MNDSPFNHSIQSGLRRQYNMTPIHAKVASAEKDREQYRLIVELVPSEFLGPFERLRFKRNLTAALTVLL
jgi:hypothetical protein